MGDAVIVVLKNKVLTCSLCGKPLLSATTNQDAANGYERFISACGHTPWDFLKKIGSDGSEVIAD